DGDILKTHFLSSSSGAEIAKQLRRSAFEPARRAIIPLFSCPIAWPGGVVIEVIDHNQIEPAIAIVIDEGARRGPGGIVQSRFRSYVREDALAVVAKQLHAVIACDEDIRPAIIIHVADGHPHVVAGDVQTRTFTGVAKSVIRRLKIQTIARAV